MNIGQNKKNITAKKKNPALSSYPLNVHITVWSFTDSPQTSLSDNYL